MSGTGAGVTYRATHADHVASARRHGSTMQAAMAGVAAVDEGIALDDCPFSNETEKSLVEAWRRHWLARSRRAADVRVADLFDLAEKETRS